MDKLPWETFKPPIKAKYILFLVRLGLSRGNLRKKLALYWQKHFGSIVDVEVDRIRYRLDISDNLTDRKILLSSTKYDAKELQILSEACKDKVFVDVGANIGYYSLELAKLGAKQVIAFEPNPPSFERLKYNVSINDFGDRIAILPFGIGEEGQFELFSAEDLGGASMLTQKKPGVSSTTIQTRPLFDVLTEMQIDGIGGLKIDIEGVEDRALLPFFQNAPKNLWPECVVIEHSHQEFWNTDIIAFMVEMGYVIQNRIHGNTVLQKKL